jgi:hypothetical protein
VDTVSSDTLSLIALGVSALIVGVASLAWHLWRHRGFSLWEPPEHWRS